MTWPLWPTLLGGLWLVVGAVLRVRAPNDAEAVQQRLLALLAEQADDQARADDLDI